LLIVDFDFTLGDIFAPGGIFAPGEQTVPSAKNHFMVVFHLLYPVCVAWLHYWLFQPTHFHVKV